MGFVIVGATTVVTPPFHFTLEVPRPFGKPLKKQYTHMLSNSHAKLLALYNW